MTSLFEQHPEWLIEQPVFVSPNLRLSRTVTAAYNLLQDQSCWEPLASYAWNQWLYALYNRLDLKGRDVPILLSSQQELLLWNQVLREADNQLLNPRGLARQLQKTRTLITHYQIPVAELRQTAHQGTEQFIDWLEAFERLLKQQRRICEYELANWLLTQPIKISRLVVLYEFPELTPLQQRFLEVALKGIDPVFFVEQKPHQHLYVSDYADAQEQYQAAISWAKTQLEQNSHQKIAIIAPQLSEDLVQVESLLQQAFHPDMWTTFQQRQSPGYNISASHSATSFQVISDALNLLALNHQDIPVDAIDRVLHSPYFLLPKHTDFLQAGMIDRHIRARKNPTIRLTELIEITEQTGCTALHDTLTKLSSTVPKYSKRQVLRTLWEWLHLFQQQLTLTGWPGNHELDTYEYQQASLWQDIMNECASLEAVIQKPIGLEAALQYLQQTAQQTQFHLQTIDSPLQVLGVLESRGLLFDKIWICGMDHNHWPPSSNPDPFIPVALQKQKNIPQCSAEKELNYARQITAEWLSHCSEVWVSYVHSDNDSTQLLSPLFQHGENQLSLLSSTPSAPLIETETIADHSLIHLDQNIPLPGGTHFLKDYIGCPFKAWAKHIMKSEAPPDPVIGLDYQDRGILLHDIMEQLWRQIRDQQTLLEYDPEELFQLVAGLIGRRVNRYSVLSRRYISPIHRDLEVKRLCKILMLWLEIEKQRPPFKVIFNESSQQYDIGTLTLNIRFDRIDKLADGSLMVVDYKTGETNVNAWLNNGRVNDPQVPIYSLVFQQEVKVAAFASLKTGHMELIGVKDNHVNEIETIKPVTQAFSKEIPSPENFQQLVELWHTILSRVAEEIPSQPIVARPTSPTVCRQCDQQPFCRIELENPNHG
ncbi:PD-(D/E)XK nuclease family protein [Gynuella sp.]|uniref:PD-(D/E)XK nuclease family protein n=1 Tax=Gynuella sp. TaxID=2969146 RepID=UPI003D129BCF